MNAVVVGKDVSQSNDWIVEMREADPSLTYVPFDGKIPNRVDVIVFVGEWSENEQIAKVWKPLGKLLGQIATKWWAWMRKRNVEIELKEVVEKLTEAFRVWKQTPAAEMELASWAQEKVDA